MNHFICSTKHINMPIKV